MALLAICGSLGAPAGVLVVALLVGAVVAVASWMRTSIRFTASDLAVTMLLWPRRIPWVHVHGVTLQDIHHSDSDEVTHQRAVIHYRRDPGSPRPPMPTVFGEYRTWARTHFRTVSLPLFFPASAGQPTPGAGPRQPRTWIGRAPGRPPTRDHPRGVRGAWLPVARIRIGWRLATAVARAIARPARPARAVRHATSHWVPAGRNLAAGCRAGSIHAARLRRVLMANVEAGPHIWEPASDWLNWWAILGLNQ